MNIEWLNQPVKKPSNQYKKIAQQHQLQLTKPAGSLGKLEDIAINLSSLQQSGKPKLDNVFISIFAADHGVAAAGVSAFPQEVTLQMLANFSTGGAAINVLANSIEAELEVVDVGTITKPNNMPKIISHRAGNGTANLQYQDAMTTEQLHIALNAGQQAVFRAKQNQADIFIGGEMGIANTTAAAAIACVLLNAEPKALAGKGTGLDTAGINRKAQVISQALERYKQLKQQPLETLRCVGGFEIAALVGAYISCAQQGIPAIVDGFITTAAALVAIKLKPEIQDWLIFSHQSAEAGHKAMLIALQAEPILNLDMRLGEGSGAATLIPLLRLSCNLHTDMATFAAAGVSAS